MEPREYLTGIKARLVASAIVTSVTVVEEYALPGRGYFRARLGLTNHDFLIFHIMFMWVRNPELNQEGQ